MPRATSLGRRFDAVSAVLGFVTVQQDEAWAAMRLEAEAQKAADAMGLADFGALPYWPDAWQIHADGVLDMTTLARALASVIGEDELSAIDKKYLEFGKAFEEHFIGQAHHENRSIIETLEIGWKLLRMLPREELDRIDTKVLDQYYEE